MGHQLLLEIGLEEQPARFIPASEEQLKEKMKDFLNGYQLSFSEIESFSTPRRLAVLVYDLAEKQEDQTEEVRGPARHIAQDEEGAWTKAGEGFAKGQGMQTDDIYFVEEKGEDYAYVKKFTAGQPALAILEKLDQVITSMTFPVSMRWGRHSFEYIRPLHWITALLDGQVIDFECMAIHSSNQLDGHRFLGERIELKQPSDYEQALQDQYVIANRSKRQAMIRQQIEQIEKEHGFTVDKNQNLLDEVTDLVEYPTAFCASFSKDYLSLPEEILITSMRDHQRYFSVRDQKGQLLPYFVSVRNGNDDYLENVIHGNEKVISARLDDAIFFYQEDQKISLDDYNEKLKEVSFYQGLGNMSQKIDRVRIIARIIGEDIGLSPDQLADLDRAAELSKFDLSSLMVNEFSELQGLMGGYYAKAAGEKDSVAKAIAEHYMPTSSQGELPQSPEGAVLSVADKLDSILMFFAVGQVPTGSNDPFALRRQAYGVLRIILDRGWDLHMKDLVDQISQAIPYPNDEIARQMPQEEEAALHFIKNRIRQYLEAQEVDHDIIKGVLDSSQDNMKNLIDNALLLNDKYDDEDHRQWVETLSRVLNLRSKAEEELRADSQINPELFESDSERALYEAYQEAESQLDEDLPAADFYQLLKNLEKPIENFFEDNFVMHDDEAIRRNRLSLLYAISELILIFAVVKELSFK